MATPTGAPIQHSAVNKTSYTNIWDTTFVGDKSNRRGGEGPRNRPEDAGR